MQKKILQKKNNTEYLEYKTVWVKVFSVMQKHLETPFVFNFKNAF